jgi:hypothetical protein
MNVYERKKKEKIRKKENERTLISITELRKLRI